MMMTLEKKMARLSPARRKKVEAHTAALIAEERSLRDLRHALATEARRQSMAAARDEKVQAQRCRRIPGDTKSTERRHPQGH